MRCSVLRQWPVLMTIQPLPGPFILQTKLNRPGVTKDLVIRPRLLKVLDDGMEGALTLVIAPAGFGKTTLVSSWMQNLSERISPIPSAWLSLNEGDSDLDTFLRYFIAAVRKIYPDAGAETLDMLSARQQPPASLMADMVANELQSLPSRFVIAIDDLHTVHGQEVFGCLNNWLRSWPSSMHLVVLSRYNPPLPLASLRGKGMLREVRTRDLRFSLSEAGEYFRHLPVISDSINDSSMALLDQRLEGWIAGLKLVSLAIGPDGDAARDLTSVLVDNEFYTADYLIDEVLNAQPPAIQEFLLTTSIVEQICVSLGEALLGARDADYDARACLDYLADAELFMIPLDNQREWYRYHRMFRDLLHQRLLATTTSEHINELHYRAANWFAGHQMPDQAIAHAMKINSLDLVARFIEQTLCDVLNREDVATLNRWLNLIPDEFIRQRPELLLVKAWDHSFRWELEKVLQSAEQAEALLDKFDYSDYTQILRGQIAMMKGQIFYHANQPERVIPYCRESLALLPKQWHYARGGAAVYLGLCLYATGQVDAAERYLSGEYESASDKINGYSLRLLLGMTINYLQAGKYENAARLARTMLQQAEDGKLAVIEGWGHYLLGFIHYEWNELELAARHFVQVVDLFYRLQWATARNGIIGLGQTYLALDQGANSLETIDRLSQIDITYRGQEQTDTTSARARLMLMEGNLEGAERWANQWVETEANPSFLPWMEQPHFTLVRILIARHKAADIQMASKVLDTLGELAERTFNTRITIEVLAHRALALMAQGDSAGAREALIRSVELARRGLFTRLYVDLGAQMQNLLVQIAGHGPTVKTVGRILAAYPGAERTAASGVRLASEVTISRPYPADDDLTEHLTPRELEVLVLMSEPISLKEIANRLNISYTTARRYTINVYSKFEVHSRWDAVDAGIRKGIIPPR